MNPVVAGLIAATAWAIANVGSTRAAHHVGTVSTVSLTTAIGLLIVAPLALVSPLPPLTERHLLGFACAGLGGVIGLLLAYRAFRVGRVAVVAPIIAAQGGVAAVLSILAGERLAPLAIAMLVVVVAGVVVVALGSRASEVAAEAGVAALDAPDARPGFRADVDPGASPRVVGLASLGALAFGLGLFGTGLLAQDLPLGWVALPSRFVGGALLLVPLAASRRLRLDRRALPWLVIVGLGDIGGAFVFALGAREAAATTAVFASQVAVVSAIGAALFLRERPTRIQVFGLVVVAVGTAVLALARA